MLCSGTGAPRRWGLLDVDDVNNEQAIGFVGIDRALGSIRQASPHAPSLPPRGIASGCSCVFTIFWPPLSLTCSMPLLTTTRHHEYVVCEDYYAVSTLAYFHGLGIR